jgi:hypothetical protein
MDPIVEAALRKWPDVPHCYGWLALDARGDWYMRDERIQAAGAFPLVKGSLIRHDKLLGFIHRNYQLDERGAAFFQNGPQRVYVELEATPWIWRLHSTAGAVAVHAHTGQAAHVRSSWVDEAGRLYLLTDLGFGIVHSMDMLTAADAIEAGAWQPQPCRADDLPQRFGFQRQPQPPAGS